MFKRFNPSDDVSSTTLVKNSVVRGMKRGICEQFPALEPFIDDIIGKKEDVKESKGADKLSFIVIDGVPLFFRVREGPYFPTLRLLHKCAFTRAARGARAPPAAAAATPFPLDTASAVYTPPIAHPHASWGDAFPCRPVTRACRTARAHCTTPPHRTTAQTL